MGISHTIAAFSLGRGAPYKRLLQAMKDTFVPLFHGCMSTSLALIPLTFAHFKFLTSYFFIPFQLVVFMGMLHGFFFLPCILLACFPGGARHSLTEEEMAAQMPKPDQIGITPEDSKAADNHSTMV